MRVEFLSFRDVISSHLDTERHLPDIRGGGGGSSGHVVRSVADLPGVVRGYCKHKEPYACNIKGIPCARGLGWVDFDFEWSTVCPILPGLIGIAQKGLGSWAK